MGLGMRSHNSIALVSLLLLAFSVAVQTVAYESDVDTLDDVKEKLNAMDKLDGVRVQERKNIKSLAAEAEQEDKLSTQRLHRAQTNEQNVQREVAESHQNLVSQLDNADTSAWKVAEQNEQAALTAAALKANRMRAQAGEKQHKSLAKAIQAGAFERQPHA